MDMQELKEKYPELVQEIRQEAMQDAGKGAQADGMVSEEEKKRLMDEAVERERSRLKEIDEIAGQIADKELLDKAKFGENAMTAQELAFEAMKRQKNAGAAFMDSLMDDAENSGAAHVNPMPNRGIQALGEEEMEDIANGAAMIARAWQ